MTHFVVILFIILEYLGMMIIEPGEVSTPVIVVILLVHLFVFIWYTNKYPNKDKE